LNPQEIHLFKLIVLKSQFNTCQLSHIVLVVNRPEALAVLPAFITCRFYVSSSSSSLL